MCIRDSFIAVRNIHHGIEIRIPVGNRIKQGDACQYRFGQRKDDPAEDLQIIAAIHSGRLLQLCGKSLKIVLDNNHVKWIYRSRQP